MTLHECVTRVCVSNSVPPVNGAKVSLFKASQCHLPKRTYVHPNKAGSEVIRPPWLRHKGIAENRKSRHFHPRSVFTATRFSFWPLDSPWQRCANGGQQKAARRRSPTSPATFRRTAEWSCRVHRGCAWRGASSGKLAPETVLPRRCAFTPNGASLLPRLLSTLRRLSKVEDDAVDACGLLVAPIKGECIRDQRGALRLVAKSRAAEFWAHTRRLRPLRVRSPFHRNC